MNIVLVAYDEEDKDKINNKNYIDEIFFQGNLTLKNRKKFHDNMKKAVFCFNSKNKNKSLLQIKEQIDTIFVVGHHENFCEIGLMHSPGITPENFCDKLYFECKENIKNIQKIIFFVCNSACDNIKNDSFCARFYNYFHAKYKNDNLIVGGFIGFLFEDPIKKRTYLTKKYNDYSKIYRADDNIIYYKK